MVRLWTLGALNLRDDAGRELQSVLAQPKRLALLTYLAVASPNGFPRRDTLVALFWPDLDQERARNALSQAVYVLRRAVGAEAVVSRGDEALGVDPERLWCDAAAFTQALQRGALEDALALYRGDLLTGFFLPDVPEFEGWLETTRAGLRDRAAVASWSLAERMEVRGDGALAVHWARHAVSLGPTDEVGFRHLLTLLDRQGERLAAVHAYEEFSGRLARDYDLEPTAETKSLLGSIRTRLESPATTFSPTPGRSAPSVEPPPFRGLRHFDVEHAHLFFGRDGEIEELLGRLRVDPFLAVVGGSGSGKSSLVRAGLLPTLLRGDFSDGGARTADWRVAVFRPGDRPLQALAAALPDLDPTLSRSDRVQVVATCDRQLQEADAGLGHCLAALVPQGDRVLLVVDQFEELFTLTTRVEERERFVASLLAAATAAGPRPTHVVITLRADFYARCWEHPELPGRIAHNQYAVRRPGRSDLRDMIEQPLLLVGARCESGLADRILADAGDEPGELPLLEHALLQLWERRGNGLLTHAAYDEIGGVRGALRRHADAVYAHLSQEERELARRTFLRLTQPGFDTEDTRRRASREEILALGGDPAAAERVLGQLVDSRLITTYREGATDVVEVTHEALIREWPLLRQWVDADRDALRVERGIIEAAAEWTRLQRDAGALHRCTRLVQAEEWARTHWEDLRPVEQAFLEASLAERDRETQEAEAQRRREVGLVDWVAAEATAREEAERRALEQAEARAAEAQIAGRRHRRLAVAGGVASAVAIVVAGAAVLAKRTADRNARVAESRQLAGASMLAAVEDPVRALVLAIEAARTAETTEARLSLRQALDAPIPRIVLGPDVIDATFSPDGKRVLTAGGRPERDGPLQLWDAATGRKLRDFPVQRSVFPSQPWFSSDPVWDDWAGSRLRFSPDGGQVLAQERSPIAWVMRRWDSATARELSPIVVWESAERPVNPTFSPDGRRILTHAFNTVRLWESATGAELRSFRGHDGWVLGAVFSPDRRWVLTWGDDGTARLWDAETGRQARAFPAHLRGVRSAVFSPDGQTVVTAGDGAARLTDPSSGAVRLWDAATGTESRLLRTGTRPVESATFGPDARWIATVEQGSGRIRRWDVATGRELALGRDFRRSIGSDEHTVTFSADGRYALTRGADRAVRLRETESGRELLVFQLASLRSAAFSPDGRQLLVVPGNGTAYLFDLDWTTLDRTPPTEFPRSIGVGSEVGGSETAASFSLDGRRVLTAGAPGRPARVWDAASGRELSTLGGASLGEDRPHDATLLLANGTKVLRSSRSPSQSGDHGINGHFPSALSLWDVATRAELRILRSRDWRIEDARLSADGRRLLTVSDSQAVRLWDAQVGRELQLLHSRGGRATGFSPDGRRVLTVAGSSGAAYLWDASTGRQLRTIQPYPGISAARFSADGRRVLTRDAAGTASLWDVETGKALQVFRGHAGWIERPQLADEVSYWLMKAAPGGRGGVLDAALSPDGRVVLTAGSDGTARTWNTADGNELRVFRGHRGPVLGATFSPDGRRVLTSSTDGTARLWEAATGEELGIVQTGRGAITRAVFSPDGRRVLTMGERGVRVSVVEFGGLVQEAESRVPASLRHRDRIHAIVAGCAPLQRCGEGSRDPGARRANVSAASLSAPGAAATAAVAGPFGTYGPCHVSPGGEPQSRSRHVIEAGNSLNNVREINILDCRPADAPGGTRIVPCPPRSGHSYCLLNEDDGNGNHIFLAVSEADRFGTYGPCNLSRNTPPQSRSRYVTEAGKSLDSVSRIDVIDCRSFGESGPVLIVPCPANAPYSYCVLTRNDGAGNHVFLGVVEEPKPR
jgi:WD40 repeat protein/DNA-binding SARP family transcriptional activator